MSDPKDCLYCQNNETLHSLMIEIARLSVSRVFLFKQQTYRGRCLVAYKEHVNDLFDQQVELWSSSQSGPQSSLNQREQNSRRN